MHSKSRSLTIGGTVLKESDDLVILGVTFDSKITFEKHLCSVFRSASQLLGILRKSCQIFHNRLLLVRYFRSFVLPVLEYCFAVCCSAADTHLKLLDRVVCGVYLFNWGVFALDIAHHRCVALLCMLYKFGFNMMHPFYGVLPLLYVSVRVTCSAFIAHWYTYASPHCRTLQYPMTFISLSVSLWNDLADPVFDGVGLVDFKSRANAFLLAYAARSLIVSYCFPFLFFLSIGWHCWTWVFGLIGFKSRSSSIALSTFYNN